MKKQTNFIKILSLSAAIFASAVLFGGCYSVFSGGAGGQIVDAESTRTPKAGIAYVDVYAYTDKQTRDSDFNSWKEGTTFAPSTAYYGHTITETDGSFTISKIIWKETRPSFGKDADYTTLYLLYYHENYGLTKDQTVITSDSTSNSVYAELTAIRKTSTLNISIYDISTANKTSNDVLVTVSVPQKTDTINAEPRIYEETITGSGSISISYPRWANAEDRADGKEIVPEISLSYSQSADEITWKACANADNEAKDYAFFEDGFSIKKTVKNSSFSISLYGKATKIKIPTINGTYGDSADASSDGKIIGLKVKDDDGNYTIDCGETTTYAEAVGTSGVQSHGKFSGLGNSFFWNDSSYTGKYSTADVKFFVDGVPTSTEMTLRSDTSVYNVAL